MSNSSNGVDFEAVLADDQLGMHYELGLCMLKGLGGHVCSGHMTIQHMINKAKTKNSPELREYCDQPALLAIVCLNANSGDGLADASWARKALVQQRANHLGETVMRRILSRLPASWGLGWDAIMTTPDPPDLTSD